jgi:hypothetical protein
MIVPTLADVVHAVSGALDEVIAPKVEGLRERSTLTTIRHLLRLVEIGIEGEGQVLYDELNKLEGLLSEVATVFATRPGLEGVAAAIRESLALERDPSIYPSLRILAQDVGRLREHVCDALVALRALPASATSADTQTAHQQLREYIAWQLKQEARIIDPAFRGHGARR